MKKLTFLFAFCFLLSASCLKAQHQQPIPNADFEIWKEKYSTYYGDYKDFETDLFYTLNSLYDLDNGPLEIPPRVLTAFQEGNAQHGAYCIKLTSGRISGGTSFVFLPGMVGTVSKEFVKEFLEPGGEGVRTTKLWEYATPHALEGYFKYIPVEGDSALINIEFYDDDGVAVVVENKIIYESVESWTKFSIPIPEKYWNEVFYEIRILFVASAGVNFEHLDECVGQLGSTLWVDNLNLNYTTTGIKQNLFSTLKTNAFPNPAAEVLNIELNENFSGKVVVYNLTGSAVMEQNISGTQCQLNTSALAAGNYMYRLMKENSSFAQGKFVVTK